MMDGNNWRTNQAMENSGMPVGGTDWRGELRQDSRQRIVNKIVDTLKKHLPISGAEGVTELNKIAVRFEEKIYTAATSKSDYLRKISLKMLTMETKSNQNSGKAVVGGGTDWRDELSPDFRQGIMETMKKIVEEIEEMIYTVARSKDDYLQRISLEMRTMERKLNPNALPTDTITGNQVCQDPGV